MFRKLDLFPSSGEGRETPTLMGPLERANHSMICFAKPGLTQGLYTVHKEEPSITCYMCDIYIYIYMRYMTEAKHILKRQTHTPVRDNVTRGLLTQGT
jgi:hypothetical protein